MCKLILVTGGSRSGKSSFAEEIAKGYGENVLYIATCIPMDEEMQHRVRKHQEQRPSDWETLEAYKNFDVCLKDKLPSKNAVLLDCITIMTSNLMFEKCCEIDKADSNQVKEIEESIRQQMDRLIDSARKSGIPFIFVTNEVGMGIVPEHKTARIFRDIAGRVNQMLAKNSDEVYLCVSGIPVKIK